MSSTRTRVAWRAVIPAVILSGCASPLDSPTRDDPSVESTVAAMIDRELEALPDEALQRTPVEPPTAVEDALAQRRDELEALSPAVGDTIPDIDLGVDLTGAEQQVVSITLEAAITSAVANNLALQVASIQPAVNAEDVNVAESVFDVVLFGSADLERVDEPSAVPVIVNEFGVTQLGTPFTNTETYRFETGVRKRFRAGGEVTVSTDLTRFRNNDSSFLLFPDPAYSHAVRLGLTQPLMRGFGEAANTADILLAENAERRAIEALRRDMLDLVERAEAAYWQLLFAWRNREIQEWLVDAGIEVRDVLDRRRDFDTKLAQFADAVARVEARKSNVIRARRAVRAASDELKVLINDPELSIGSEAVLKPSDPLQGAPITYDVRQAMLTAVANRPEIQIALLSIDDAGIIERLADNGRLPLLNLAAEVAWFGLDADADDAIANTFDNDFIDYVVGVNFEYPIGNEGPEAAFRRSRLQRSQTLVGYRNEVQNVIFEVKSALRDVITNYELVYATRSSRIAEAENLRTLLVEEETLAGLTPEFLNLKFQRQNRLAITRAEEIQAVVNFDTSLAALYRAMGTGLSMKGISIWEGDRLREWELDIP
jgi:outer membrane protein TolC